MTACTNHGGKARRVVTAALVGVLSVGTVPMVALATGTADGIETLVADWSTDAKVSAAEDGKGSVFTGDLSKPVSFDLGSGKYLVPTEVTGQAGTTDILDAGLELTYDMPVIVGNAAVNNVWNGLAENGAYYIDGIKDEAHKYTIGTGTSVNVSADFAASYFAGTLTDLNGLKVKPVMGTYVAKVSDGVNTVSKSFTLEVENSYAGTYAYIVNSADASDTDDKDLVYDGTTQTIALAKSDGTKIAAGSGVTVEWYKSNGELISKRYEISVSGTGSYSAVVKDSNNNTVATVNFSVEKYDVSKHGDSYSDTTTLGSGEAAKKAILQKVAGSLWKSFQVTDITAPSGAKAFDDSYGEYTVTISAKVEGDSFYDANVTGQKTIKFSYLNDDLYDTYGLYYGATLVNGGGFATNPVGGTVSVNLTEGQSFDASKIKVRDEDGTPSWSGDQLEVTYKNASGTTVDASALSQTGTYTVTVRVKPFQDENQWLGGTRTFTVSVNGNKAYGDNVVFYLDGEIAGTSGTLEYDGTDLLERVSAAVSNPEGGSFEYGTDFTFTVTKDGEEVDSIVDAGEYKIAIKPITFTIDDGEDIDFTLTVTPQTVDQLTNYYYNGEQGFFPTNKNDLGGNSYPSRVYHNDAVAWTGSAVEVPGVQYVDGDEVKTLDPSLYNVVSVKKGDKVVKEAVDEGTYTVRIALSDAAKANYSLEEREFTFQVVKYNPFDDVKSPAWYASAVADAKFTNVVNGMSGTNMYAPEARISRADAVGILFNLAGGSALLDDNMYTEEGGWLTGFDDVDGNAYYAGALAWAHKAGVVNGHGGNFRPNDSITREELATMLANYAKATGDFVASDGSALAAIADGADVSGWAQESVAWAVENEIMGNGGFVAAHTDITRAEVAAMAVNYADKF